MTRERDQDRGYSGPIRLSYGTLQHPISKAFIESAVSAGFPENNGFNGPSQIGAGFYELTIADGKRSGAFKYLDRAKGRSNLTLMANCRVRRIAMEGTRARGVVIEKGGREITISAEREVLLTSGAIGSPQLLMLSGIGPADHLRSLGIKPVLDSAGVGEQSAGPSGLRNSLGGVAARYADAVSRLDQGGLAGAQYILRGTGPATSQGVEAGAFWGPDKNSSWPEWQAHLIVALRNPPPNERIPHGLRFAYASFVRRAVERCDCDRPTLLTLPLSIPAFYPTKVGFRQHARRCSADCARLSINRRSENSLNAKIDIDAFTSVDSRKKWIRARAETIYHPVGTCRMGEDATPSSMSKLAGSGHRQSTRYRWFTHADRDQRKHQSADHGYGGESCRVDCGEVTQCSLPQWQEQSETLPFIAQAIA